MVNTTHSHYLEINGNRLHYVSEGKGKPVVFVHGIPTSSYLWRHILPEVSHKAQGIALDLIGMGRSDKPDIQYTLDDHIHYFTKFIETLELKNITLVMHGWGSVIGLSYACRHPDNIAGIALLEGYLRLPDNPLELPLPIQEVLASARNHQRLRSLIVEDNYLVEKLLPAITLKKFSKDEHDNYRTPFYNVKHRKILWQFMQEQPYLNPESDSSKRIKHYSTWLQETSVQKLLMYGLPGFITGMSTVKWAMDNLSNLTIVDLGHGLHYLPETRSPEIADALSKWLEN